MVEIHHLAYVRMAVLCPSGHEIDEGGLLSHILFSEDSVALAAGVLRICTIGPKIIPNAIQHSFSSSTI